MSAQNAKREKELIEQIKKLRCDQSALDNDYQGCEDCCKMIANWHLAEVKRIVEPLLKALKKADNEDCAFGQCDIYEEAIDETLKRANGGE